MERRILGRTGLETTILGLGGFHLLEISLADRFATVRSCRVFFSGRFPLGLPFTSSHFSPPFIFNRARDGIPDPFALILDGQFSVIAFPSYLERNLVALDKPLFDGSLPTAPTDQHARERVPLLREIQRGCSGLAVSHRGCPRPCSRGVRLWLAPVQEARTMTPPKQGENQQRKPNGHAVFHEIESFPSSVMKVSNPWSG